MKNYSTIIKECEEETSFNIGQFNETEISRSIAGCNDHFTSYLNCTQEAGIPEEIVSSCNELLSEYAEYSSDPVISYLLKETEDSLSETCVENNSPMDPNNTTDIFVTTANNLLASSLGIGCGGGSLLSELHRHNTDPIQDNVGISESSFPTQTPTSYQSSLPSQPPTFDFTAPPITTKDSYNNDLAVILLFSISATALGALICASHHSFRNRGVRDRDPQQGQLAQEQHPKNREHFQGFVGNHAEPRVAR